MAGRTKAATNGNGTPQSVTKREAVRQVLERHGKDTMPQEICRLVKAEFGLDLTTAHASNIKSTLGHKKSKRRGGGRRKGGRRAAAAPQLQVAARTSKGSGRGITASEVAAVQVLINQLGADELKRLIDVLDK
jgi:hypothetical protein